MKKSVIRTAALILVLVVSASGLCFAKSPDDIIGQTELSARYISEKTKNPTVSSVGGEWAVIGLARSGMSEDNAIFENYKRNLKETLLQNGGVLHRRKYTEYARATLALSAIGEDPTSFCGYNLTLPLSDYDKVMLQGINGPVWALIALDSNSYIIPETATATRDKYVDAILARALADGGWSLDGKSPAEADITAMALTALAPYRCRDDVFSETEKALLKLSSMQSKNGAFSSDGKETCESTAQVLVALCTLGISADDARFVKNGKTVADALLSFRLGNGSFCHTPDKKEPSQMSGEQAFYALAAYERSIGGKAALFDMKDVRYRELGFDDVMRHLIVAYQRYKTRGDKR